MRENMGMYRGKRVDTGEWVRGYLVVYPDLIGRTGKETVCIHAGYVGFSVDPDTVGADTGLTDKNGTRIHEGDLFDKYNVVEWCNGGFCVNGDSPLEYWAGNHCVIGNIHDKEVET